MIDLDTFIISDTHFGHFNIIRFCDRPLNHEDIIIRNWQNTVPEDATILHLGDVAFGKPREIYDWAEIIKDLPGRKLLIKGNHDHSRSMKIYKGIFEVIDPFIQEFAGVRFYFSHYPDHPIKDQWDVNIHGHIHNNPLPLTPEPVNTPGIYQNVSIEVTNYSPVQLSSILRKLKIPFE